jgi:hypothetical protein
MRTSPNWHPPRPSFPGANHCSTDGFWKRTRFEEVHWTSFARLVHPLWRDWPSSASAHWPTLAPRVRRNPPYGAYQGGGT